MKKTGIIIVCVAVGVCLLTVGVLIARSVWHRLRFRTDELESCSVSTGGGMLGGHRSLTLTKQKDGSVTLTVRERETHADREVITTYPADEAALAHVKELVNAHNLYGASKRRYSRIRVLDGDTTTLSFDYASGYFSVSEEQVMNPNMCAGFDAVEDWLNSLAVGDGVVTLEPQRAMLYLKSGYTLQYVIEDAFDGRLDSILSEEREVSAFGTYGIVLCEGVQPDCSGAAPVDAAAAGTMVYDGESGQIVLLCADCAFGHDIWVLAQLDGYVPSACPLLAEMEGAYRLYLN